MRGARVAKAWRGHIRLARAVVADAPRVGLHMRRKADLLVHGAAAASSVQLVAAHSTVVSILSVGVRAKSSVLHTSLFRLAGEAPWCHKGCSVLR